MRLQVKKPPITLFYSLISVLVFLLCFSFFAFRPISETVKEGQKSPEYTSSTISVCPNSSIVDQNLSVVVGDNEPPTITLNGDAEIKLDYGKKFEDPGASAVDNCDKVSVKTEGEVSSKEPGTYTITYSATDESGNTGEIKRTVTVKKRIVQQSSAPTSGSKIIYLTFDDGPSIYTSALLDTLKKYNVKATFFVTGAGSDDILRREYNEGHSIGLHTFSHGYSYIYSSTDNFFADLYKIQNRVENATGLKSYLMRFPGGSSNTVSRGYDGGSHIMSRLARQVTDAGFAYFDWNISSGDAGGASTSSQVANNVIRALGSGSYVVLQHDTKGFSVAAVETIIQYGLQNGYTFLPLSMGSPTAHHGISN